MERLTERLNDGTTERLNDGTTERKAHPTSGVYLAVAGVLIVITLVEVGVFYVPALQVVLVPLLLVLSGAKFALVVMFYMHLKTDHRLFTLVFTLPLLIAVGVIVALLFLFGVLAIGGSGQVAG